AASADITAAEADVAQAQAELDAAKLKLANATLTAPFAGTVAVVAIIPGSTAGAGTAAVTLVDMTAPHIDVNVNHGDIGRGRVGQPVSITFEALPNVTLAGTVESIATTATAGQNVVTYLVQVRFDPGDAAVKIDMSADVSIEVERHPKVLQVPSRAIKSAGGEKTVQVLYGADQTPVTVRVQTGATNGAMTEIVSCLDIGKQCLREGDRVVLNLPSGTASGGPDGNGDFTVAAPGPSGGAPAG